MYKNKKWASEQKSKTHAPDKKMLAHFLKDYKPNFNVSHFCKSFAACACSFESNKPNQSDKVSWKRKTIGTSDNGFTKCKHEKCKSKSVARRRRQRNRQRLGSFIFVMFTAELRVAFFCCCCHFYSFLFARISGDRSITIAKLSGLHFVCISLSLSRLCFEQFSLNFAFCMFCHLIYTELHVIIISSRICIAFNLRNALALALTSIRLFVLCTRKYTAEQRARQRNWHIIIKQECSYPELFDVLLSI